MGRTPVHIGAVGRAVAANLVAARGLAGLTQEQLAVRVSDEGRPMRRQAVLEIETLRRRVDVDDLVCLAAALGVSCEALLSGDRVHRRDYSTEELLAELGADAAVSRADLVEEGSC